MTILLLKLTLSPIMIAAASLTARRFGPAAGGWLIGLPVTAGPVALVLTLEHSTTFTARIATGFVAGVAAQAAFVFGYAAITVRGGRWTTAIIAGTSCFAVTGISLEVSGMTLAGLLAVALLCLVVGLHVVPADTGLARAVPGRRALLLRMAAATTMVLAVTSLASTLGPGLSGVVTTFPLLSTILAVSVHRTDPRAAVAVYRGLLVGLFALAGFATTLALVVSRLPLAAAFALAVALTLSIQLGSLPTLRRTSSLRA